MRRGCRASLTSVHSSSWQRDCNQKKMSSRGITWGAPPWAGNETSACFALIKMSDQNSTNGRIKSFLIQCRPPPPPFKIWYTVLLTRSEQQGAECVSYRAAGLPTCGRLMGWRWKHPQGCRGYWRMCSVLYPLLGLWSCPPRQAHIPALLWGASGEGKAIRGGKKSRSLKESSAETLSWKRTINHVWGLKRLISPDPAVIWISCGPASNAGL